MALRWHNAHSVVKHQQVPQRIRFRDNYSGVSLHSLMSTENRKTLKLMQYGIDSETAKLLVGHGYGVTKLRNTTLQELGAVLNDEKARAIKKAILRSPIPEETISRLVDESRWSCCLCWSALKTQPVVVHHIEPYESTQDNSYDNLVVLCPTHHAEAHSSSTLTGDLIPKQKVRQQKRDYIDAIREALDGKRPLPGNEPSPTYWWSQIQHNCRQQADTALHLFANVYDPHLYVHRDIEADFERFSRSDATGFLIVDRAGQGKSNLICSLVSRLCHQEKAAILIRGDVTLTDENSLERLLCSALGYEQTNFQLHLELVSQTLVANHQLCYVFLDGISENSSPSVASRSLANLIARLAQLGGFKLIVTCRDTAWHRIGHELPIHLFFQSSITSQIPDHRFRIQELSDQELDECLLLYKRKYKLDFSLTTSARAQLKHPLMLRLFCEANQGESLQVVSIVHAANIFELYLARKTEAIAHRLDHKYESTALQRVLRALAFETWHEGNVNLIDESQWHQSMRLIVGDDGNTIINEYESEGIIELHTDELTLERKLGFVFDRLRDYLLLGQLIALLPEQVRRNLGTSANYKALLSHVNALAPVVNDFMLLSLIGMKLPEAAKRRDFLDALLQFDVHTFCACIAQITPTGRLSKCDYMTQRKLAEELRRWYERIAILAFPAVYRAFDPWNRDTKTESVGVQTYVSPQCKEISYHYVPAGAKISSLAHVKMTSGYPTWRLSFASGSDEVALHDPENGIIIPVFRDGPDGNVTRTINYKFMPRFPGDSYNVPERMALWDIWEELKHLIQSDLLPFRSYILTAETAWSIASKIPDITAEGLDLAAFQRQLPKLITKYSSSYDGHVTPSKLAKLETLLGLLPRALSIEDYPSSYYGVVLSRSLSATTMSDNNLRDYLFRVFSGAINAYRVVVEAVFASVKSVLNTYANMPCSVGIVTDRESLRYALLPVPTWEEAEMRGLVRAKGELRIADPNVRFVLQDEQGNSASFEEGVHNQLRQLNKLRPPVHPIDRIATLDDFFVETPMNNLVQQWLLRDLDSLFGF